MLLVTSNGVGLGHVTRALAIARRLDTRGVRPVLVTMSPIVAELRAAAAALGGEILVEHVQSYRVSGLPRWRWQAMLADQLTHLTAVHHAELVTFDGVSPYRGVRQAALAEGAPPYVWVRRGRWKPGTAAPDATGFSLIIEPGEPGLAGARSGPSPAMGGLRRDPEPARGARVPVRSVGAVLAHDHDDLLGYADARRGLGLADTRSPAILVSLGVGGADGLAAAERLLCAALVDRGHVPVLARSPLTDDGAPCPVGAHAVRRYPLAPLLGGVQAAVVAAGYNSVAEVLACGVASALVPSPAAVTDDQAARARSASAAGAALVWDGTEDSLPRLLDLLLDPTRQLAMRRAALALPRATGADEAAAVLIDLLDAHDSGRPSDSTDDPPPAQDAEPEAGPTGEGVDAPTPWRPRAADLVFRLARALYGRLLAVAPPTAADRLRRLVASQRHRLPTPAMRRSGAIALPGDPSDPPVLVACIGGPSASTLQEVAAVTAALPVRAVHLTDGDDVRALDGRVLERVPPAEDLGPDAASLLAARLAAVRRRYRVRASVVLHGPAPPLDAVLQGLIDLDDGP